MVHLQWQIAEAEDAMPIESTESGGIDPTMLFLWLFYSHLRWHYITSIASRYRAIPLAWGHISWYKHVWMEALHRARYLRACTPMSDMPLLIPIHSSMLLTNVSSALTNETSHKLKVLVAIAGRIHTTHWKYSPRKSIFHLCILQNQKHFIWSHKK